MNPLASILQVVDLTTLESTDTEQKVLGMIEKTIEISEKTNGLLKPAALCVYPTLVHLVKNKLSSYGIKAAAVAAGFPSGQTSIAIKVAETKWAVSEGADEIDMVINRGQFIAGNYSYTFDEIAAIKEACGKAHLKVILETGEIGNFDAQVKAGTIAIEAGADFLKTSTGKSTPAATPESAKALCTAIKNTPSPSGQKIGFKAAGGIATVEDAEMYMNIVRETLGDEWVQPDLFRIGASRLVNAILDAYGVAGLPRF